MATTPVSVKQRPPPRTVSSDPWQAFRSEMDRLLDRFTGGFGPPSATMPELESKLIAHRNKILGLWAAERMGMMGEVAVEYALGLVGTAGDVNRDDTAFAKKICKDMRARGYPIAEGDVGRQLMACADQARTELHDPKS